MSTYTSSLGLEKITPGSQAGLWGNTTNNTYDLIDQAITGITEIAFSGAGATYTLTDDNGAYNEARSAVLNVTGSATGSNTIVIPNKQKTYYVRNDTGQEVVVQTPVGTTPCPVGKDYNLPVFCDGNNNVFLAILAPGAGTLTVSGGGTGKTTFNAGGFIKSPGGTADLTASTTVNAATEISGVLPVANGGTGQSSIASGSLVVGSGTGAVGGITPVGYNGYVLTSNGSAWYPAPSASAGVTSVSSSTIGVTPTSGNVVITLSGTNVTNALGYTPYNSSNPAGYVTSSALSGYATTSQLSNYMPLSGGTFTGANPITINPNAASPILVTSGTNGGLLTPSSVGFGPTSTGFYYSTGQINALINGFGGFAINSSANFTVYNKGYQPGGGSWADSSDARLKENITPLTGSLNKICALNPVTFDWKYDRPGTPSDGFIADDVVSVFPNAVTETDPTEEQKPFIPEGDKVKNIGWQNDMIAYLVGAIKELKAEIDELKAAK